MTKQPTHRIVLPIEREGKKTYWHDLGSGWQSESGSIVLDFNSFPVKGSRVVIVAQNSADDELSDIDTDVVLAGE